MRKRYITRGGYIENQLITLMCKLISPAVKIYMFGDPKPDSEPDKEDSTDTIGHITVLRGDIVCPVTRAGTYRCQRSE